MGTMLCGSAGYPRLLWLYLPVFSRVGLCGFWYLFGAEGVQHGECVGLGGRHEVLDLYAFVGGVDAFAADAVAGEGPAVAAGEPARAAAGAAAPRAFLVAYRLGR